MNKKYLLGILVGLCLMLASSQVPASEDAFDPTDRDPELGEYSASKRWPGWYCADYVDGRNKSSWFSKPPGDRELSVQEGNCAFWERKP